MKACAKYQQEMATCVNRDCEATAEVAAHFRACPLCAAAFTEIKGAAAIQARAAQHLPEPPRSIELDTWFHKTVSRPRARQLRFGILLHEPIFALGCAITLLLVAALYFRQHSGLTGHEPTRVMKNNLPHLRSAPPTWQALRREVASGNLPTTDTLSGGFVAHYRLKDSHSDVN